VTAEEQGPEIGGCQHHNQADGADQHQQRPADVADNHVAQRRDRSALSPVLLVTKLSLPRWHKRPQLTLNGVHINAVVQSPDRLRDRALVEGGRDVEGQRHPEFRVAPEQLEIRRHHPNDLVRRIFERHDAAKHVPVAAKSGLPQREAEHRHAMFPRTIFAGCERAADERRRANDIEQICRHLGRRDAHRLADTHERHRPPWRRAGDR
jgi:hypothetical protein